MSIYETVISILDKLGFFDIILPFILIYAIIYGILAKTQILGNPFDQDQAKARFVRSIISLISLSVAFLTIGTINVIIKMKIFIPYVVLYMISIFMLIVSVAAFYLPSERVDENEYKKYRKVILILSLIIFSILTLSSLGVLSVGNLYESTTGFLQSELFVITFIMLVILAAIYWLTRYEVGGQGGGQQTK